ncbi:copper resistance protein B [Oceanospirillaceae bacterium G-43]|uniref:Copper resistance protein B n=2 Tax=Parathalassolituus penaei TaxID=2997323 RepID=A0A9X3EPY6_9GAMM|nr:copper resistance protein B [Parathalassolituus penaei]
MDSHSFSSLKVNELEQVNEGDNGIARVSGEFWYGTTWDRAVLEFDAERDNGATDAELGAYWQHAYTAFWNTRLGVRQDISPEVKRTWLGAGFEGLAPYWFESEAMLFVGEEGVAELALHSDYDLLLSQRLVLQPSLQASFHNKQDPKGQFDAGLSNSTLGGRLRYEFTRQFAPYVGVEREHWFGGSADLVGERAVNRWMAGVKFWF